MEVTYPARLSLMTAIKTSSGLDPEFRDADRRASAGQPQLIDTKFTSLILGIGKKYDAVISGMYVTPERQKPGRRHPLRTFPARRSSP
ncbi:extracellular solute-binding family protein 3 [Klebsiella pneumoniae]|uniref:Extracellular solute-binding family protein 3 n=1 Tax=Klebsiella pneumoniae TaxID=573 RepID=A0A2X3CR95_KLEPN|nr:extracellular solute-binding family protein 3 [Klebsiella pneumoniae]